MNSDRRVKNPFLFLLDEVAGSSAMKVISAHFE
jgi:hypothetical protein